MSTITHTPTATARSARRAGVWCLAAGIIGGVQAGIVLIWPEQVSDDRFSYPFTGFGYGVAQATFFLQHLPLIVGVVALLWLPAVRASRVARIAICGAAAGLGLLALTELAAITAHDATAESDRAALVESLYGPPVVLIGVSLLVAGAALLRRGRAGWDDARWLPVLVLLLGAYVFVPLTPAIMGSFTAGRLGIGGWMLLFAIYGYELSRTDSRDARTSTR